MEPSDLESGSIEEFVDEYNSNGLRKASDEEIATLRKVSGNIPFACFFICLIEFSERGSYYGVTGCLSNFIQFDLPEGGNGAGATKKGTQETPGALGLGLQAASALTLLLTFLAYVAPLVSDFKS